MARSKRIKDNLTRVERELEGLSASEPFECIAAYVRDQTDVLRQYLEDGAEPLLIQQAAGHLLEQLRKLPMQDVQTERFLFDVAMMQTIANHWSSDKFGISILAYPDYSYNEWAHARIYPEVLDPHQPKLGVDIVGFPGSGKLADVDLLEYPWLLHELGHGLFRANKTGLEDRLNEFIAEILKQERLRSIPIQGEAQQRHRNRMNTKEKRWTPTRNQLNWSHEIASDLVATWTTGPAFLASFLASLEQDRLDPFQLTVPHPPYDIRCHAIAEAGRRLGWINLADQLEETRASWHTGLDGAVLQANYTSLADIDLTAGLVGIAFEIFGQIQLPRCTPDGIRIAEHRIEKSNHDFGIDLLLDAYLAYEKLGDEAASKDYHEWEINTITELAQRVTL